MINSSDLKLIKIFNRKYHLLLYFSNAITIFTVYFRNTARWQDSKWFEMVQIFVDYYVH